MVEFIGLLKVTIKKGTNLAIRDMMSSDPYVVLNLGKQVSDLFVTVYPASMDSCEILKLLLCFVDFSETSDNRCE